jgi:hypothetical protein
VKDGFDPPAIQCCPPLEIVRIKDPESCWKDLLKPRSVIAVQKRDYLWQAVPYRLPPDPWLIREQFAYLRAVSRQAFINA